tara:strand:- start:965 stop:1156 length:192 start_codon:yes stop_codon:yes gene_type:complete
MEELFDKILAPYMTSMPEFVISILGLLGTLSYIVPAESKLGRILGKMTGTLGKLKNYLLKKKK